MNISEHELTNIHGRVSQLEADVGHLDRNITILNGKMDHLVTLISNNNKTNWATLGTWAAVILSLVYAFGAPLLDKDTRHQSRIDTLWDNQLDSVRVLTEASSDIKRIDGDIVALKAGLTENDSKSMERHQRTNERIDNLDVALQREMRDLDAIGEQRDKSLDDMLQREMRMLTEIAELRGKSNDEKLEALSANLKEQVEEINSRLRETESTRFTSSDGKQTYDIIIKLQEEVAELKALASPYKNNQ